MIFSLANNSRGECGFVGVEKVDNKYIRTVPIPKLQPNFSIFISVKVEYQIIPPSGRLAEYIQFFWTLESDQPYEHRSLADSGVELIFHYKGTFDEIKPQGNCSTALSAVRGTSSSYQVYACKSAFGIFGVYFYPFAIPALFAMPTNELSNEIPDLDTFLGTAGKELEEKMMTSRNNLERIRIISKFLEERITASEKKDKQIHRAIYSIIHTTGKLNIDLLSEECSLSRRQFERKFKCFAGFSPKMYERIVRFQNAADEYKNQNKSLTQIALENGYYDHSHFSNDFKKFSGHNPKDYFSGTAVGHEWRDSGTGMS